MWDEKILKIIPSMLFLYCLLETFELGLIITDINKFEKMELQLKQNLKTLKTIANSLNEYSERMGLKCLKDKKIKIE